MLTLNRLVTAPLYTIATSMQLSVKSHITIYGDVKESEVNKPSIIRKALGIPSHKQIAHDEKAIVEVKSDLMKPVEPRADLMKASG